MRFPEVLVSIGFSIKSVRMQITEILISREIIPKYDTVFIYDVPIAERTQIAEFCYQNMKNVYINPEMADVIELNSHHIILDDVSLLELSGVGLNADQPG